MSFLPHPLLAAGRAMLTKLAAAGLLIALLTLAVDTGIIIRLNPYSPTGGDGPYYIGLAKSLASGRGYCLRESFWPNQPNVSRSPLWPAMLSAPAFLFPNANGDAILRFTGAALHAVSAVLIVLLTFQLTGSLAGSALAGAFLGLYPPAVALVSGGYSELAFLAVTLAGVILVFEGGKLSYAGTLLTGIGVLARSNYVLLPAALFAVTAFLRPKALLGWRNLRLWLIGGAVFSLPAALWVARNYAVSGCFPVLSALEGETLYGGNNERVASDLSVWGYWIMPDEIPGEKTKRELAQSRDGVHSRQPVCASTPGRRQAGAGIRAGAVGPAGGLVHRVLPSGVCVRRFHRGVVSMAGTQHSLHAVARRNVPGDVGDDCGLLRDVPFHVLPRALPVSIYRGGRGCVACTSPESRNREAERLRVGRGKPVGQGLQWDRHPGLSLRYATRASA